LSVEMIDSKSGEAKMYGEAEKLVASRKAARKLNLDEQIEPEAKEEKEDEQLTEIFAGQEDQEDIVADEEAVNGGEDGK